ncbi:glycosyltransferase 61 family protein [Roseomonas sp. F4]
MPEIDWIEQAVVVPSSGPGRGPGGLIVDGGVLRPDGSLVEHGRHRGDRIMEMPPAVPDAALPVTQGRAMFGGWLQPHFGHFMAFSIGRLWAIAALKGQVDEVVFLQLHGVRGNPARNQQLATPIKDVLAHLGLGTKLPYRILTAPERFAQLAVPAHLILSGDAPDDHKTSFVGMLNSMRRSPGIRNGLVTPRLYVSRRLLPEDMGGMLFEDLLEENLMAEGYSIMYPERLTIAEQVAVYDSARDVIFADGSAIHLGVGFLRRENPVAVIARRPATNPRPGYLMSAGLRRSWLVDTVVGGVVTLDGDNLTDHATVLGVGILDFAKLRDDLVAAELITGRSWRCPSQQEQQAAIDALIAARKAATPGRTVRQATREELMAARLSRRRPPG